MMTHLIDVHSHYYPPPYLKAVAKLMDLPGVAGSAARFTSYHPFLHTVPFFTGAFDERLALMDRAGIQTQMLSFSSPNVWASDPAISAELAAIFNDGCAEVVARYPGHFHFLASLPLPHVAELLHEAARALQLGQWALASAPILPSILSETSAFPRFTSSPMRTPALFSCIPIPRR
jgi:predicted TIM-barrel fold metal-dependent hydrolase